jgi:hypothetical protein
MMPGHLAPAAYGLAHFFPISSNALMTVWQRGHIPTGRSRLTMLISALFGIKKDTTRKPQV